MVEGVLLFVASLTLMIIIHEAGHLRMATNVGMHVEHMYIGVPSIFKFHWGSTTIHIGLIPLLGWVKMPDDFNRYSWWRQALVLLAGPGIGLLTSLLFIMISLIGVENAGLSQTFLHIHTNTCDPSMIRNVAQMYVEYFNIAGIWGFLFLTGNFGCLVNAANLLPIPGLDGGRLLMSILQFIPAVKKDATKEMGSVGTAITAICFLLIIGYSIYAFGADIVTLIMTAPKPC